MSAGSDGDNDEPANRAISFRTPFATSEDNNETLSFGATALVAMLPFFERFDLPHRPR
jgi:hypothetical protein